MVELLPLPGESHSLRELPRLLRSSAFTGGPLSEPELRWLADKLAARAAPGESV